MTAARKTLVCGGGPGVLARCGAAQHAGRIAIGAQDGTLKLVRAADLTELGALDQNTDPVSAVAFHPKEDWFACASAQTVAICKLSTDSATVIMDGFLARTVTDIHDLTFSPNGDLIAVASGESDIKLVSTASPSQSVLAQGHGAPVRSVAFSAASSQSMASIGTDGRVLIWSVPAPGQHDSAATDSAELPRRLQQPYDAGLLCSTGGGVRNGPRLHWHRGRLAVPARRDVVVLERVASSWKTVLRLSGAHSAEVAIVRWSPNGRYLATVGSDSVTGSEVRIWDVVTKASVAHRPSASPIWALEWSPQENSVSLLSEVGELLIWEEPVPREMPHPAQPQAMADHAGQDAAAAADDNGGDGEGVSIGKASRSAADDMEEDEEDDEEDEEEGDDDRPRNAGRTVSQELQRKRRRLINCDDFDNDDDREDDDGAGQYDDDDDGSSESGGGRYRTDRAGRRSLQPPFQPGSTREGGEDPWLMTWNLIGQIQSSAVVDGVTRRVQISFTDIDSRPRIRLTDRLGFTKAVLGKHSALFSSPSRHVNNVPATVFYRNFESWAANSDWSVTLPEGEDVTGIALCGRNVAVCSDKGLLRLLTHSGIHERVVYLDHDLVCVVGAHDQPQLAVIVTPAPDQYRYVLYQFGSQIRQLESGPCPVTRGSTVSWAGYSDEGMLLIMDSAMSVRGLVQMPGVSTHEWVPILDGAAHSAAQGPRTTIWPVAASATDLLVATLRNGVTEPSAVNRPILNGIPFSVPPLLGVDPKVVALEQSSLLNRVALARLEALGQHGSQRQRRDVRQAAARLRMNQDRTLIDLFAAAVDDNNLSRALDVATHLSSAKVMTAARRLAELAQQPQLRERLDLLARAMFPDDPAAGTAAAAAPESATSHAGPSPVTAATDRTPAAEPAAPCAPAPADTVTSSTPAITAQPTPIAATQSMKPDFRRRPLSSAAAPVRTSMFSTQLDQKRQAGGGTPSSRPF